ncbi:nucleotide sugar dehydrogenase [bacterium]|nr:nucleotide sugar dehydrogenase [bacterium]
MRLKEKKVRKYDKIAIIGLGYVGLPLAVEFAQCDLSVIGIDKDLVKVNQINKGKSYIKDVEDNALKKVVNRQKLRATDDFSSLKKVNIIIICVPTPLRKTKDPDISYVISATKEISKYLQKGQLIVLESTTYPGTTREVIVPLLEERGYKVGRDFYLAFSPERVDPGNKKYAIKNTPKVIGGIDKKSTHLACLLYGKIVEKVIPVSSPEVAEMVKLLENTFRSVNIGLVNEIALVCNRLNLDVWEIIDAAASKPFGFMPFYPGPGLGGHCIPIDPHYLSWKLKSLNFYAHFIELAGEINNKMPGFVVEKVFKALNERKKCIKNANIVFLGIAYKKDVSDVRESPALDIMQLLENLGARIKYIDPYVPQVKVKSKKKVASKMNYALLRNADAVIITTAHTCFDYEKILKTVKLIIDTRGVTRKIKFGQHKVVRL